MVRASASVAPLRLLPEKEAERAGQDDERDEAGAHEEREGEDRFPRIARRPLHEVGFLRLEDEHQPEQQRGHEVDPEHLHGQRRRAPRR